MSMVRRIVDRCHVGESNLSVIRYLLSTMKKGAFRKAPRDQRRAILSEAIKRHRENRELFRHYRF